MRPGIALLPASLFLAAAFLLPTGCRRSAEPSSPPEATRDEASTDSASPAASSTPPPIKAAPAKPEARPQANVAPPPAEIWKEFSGTKAMEEVEKQVAFGPRPAGSVELLAARKAIVASLQNYGWVTELQEFNDTTPRGSVHFVNIIARHADVDGRPPVATTPRAIVCSHYDTKRFSTIKFVGASDGASSTGALVELARVLSLDPSLAAKLELVFFDGEEAVQNFSDTDGLYGSRYYATSLGSSGRLGQFKFAILWDMIGDKDLTITLPPDSPKELTKGIFEAAETLHVRDHFTFLSRDITDDHVPLQARHIPSIDLIDF